MLASLHRSQDLTRKWRAVPFSCEDLEARLLLCGDSAAHAALAAAQHPGTEIVRKYDQDGNQHLTLEEYEALPAREQNQLDPHLIDDPRFEGPVDFDELLGLPQRGALEDILLPDFFPQLDSAVRLDQTSQPGRTLARFGTQVNNQGRGPAILISGRPGMDPIPTGAPISSWVNPDGSQNVLQAIYNYNGSSFVLSHYLAGGQFTYHTGHGHFHFDGYAFYRLRHNVGGQPGAYVTRSDGTEVVGEKVGFCLINTSPSFTMENGQSSTTLPTYNRPGQPSTGCGLLQGVHVGKADEYSDGLSGQWVDVTGVPNGQYFLEIALDGQNAILESDETNNAKSFAFTLNANPPAGGIPPDVFDDGGTNNNSFETATDMGELGPLTQTGLTIHWGLDYDYFRFVATSTGNYSISMSQANGNVDLFVYDANRNLIGSSSNESGTDTVTQNFVKGQTYYVKTEAYNSSTSSNYQLVWNIKPEASSGVQGSTEIRESSGRKGKFTISRNGPTTTPLTVHFTLSGTATRGVDYQDVPLSVTLGDLQSTAVIEIIPISDSLREGRESVILTLSSNNAYVLGSTEATLHIVDSRPLLVPAALGDVSARGSGGPRQDPQFESLDRRRIAAIQQAVFQQDEEEYSRQVELLFGRAQVLNPG